MPSRYPGSCRIKWDLGTLFFLSVHSPADLQQWKHLPCEDKGDKLKQTNTKKKTPSLALIYPQSKILFNSSLSSTSSRDFKFLLLWSYDSKTATRNVGPIFSP